MLSGKSTHDDEKQKTFMRNLSRGAYPRYNTVPSKPCFDSLFHGADLGLILLISQNHDNRDTKWFPMFLVVVCGRTFNQEGKAYWIILFLWNKTVFKEKVFLMFYRGYLIATCLSLYIGSPPSRRVTPEILLSLWTGWVYVEDIKVTV